MESPAGRREGDVVARSVALGASGYLLKGCTKEELLQAIRTAAAGESAWTRDELRRVTGALATPRLSADVEVPLTQRESEVLRQLAYGLTNKEIADELGLSPRTVENHRTNMCAKLDVHGIHSLVKFAYENKSRL